MAKITKLPSGNYGTRVYDKKTKKQKHLTAPTKAELKRLVADYLYYKDRPLEDVTIKEAIDTYISNRSSVASPSTIHGYRQLQRNYYKNIEVFSVATITSEDIQREVNRWAEKLSPKTVRNIYSLLLSSIQAVYPDKAIKVRLPQKKVVEYAIPTEKEVSELIARADHDLKIAIMLAAIGTLRRGEIAALEYSDIKGNTIHVHRDRVKNERGEWVTKETAKTSASDRYIDFPQKVVDEIGQGEGRIIKRSPNDITKAFIKLRNELGLKCRFHDLRHYAASIMHAIGIPDQYIMARGGWGSDGVLKSVYRNTLTDKSKEFSDKTNDYMDKLLPDDQEEPEEPEVPDDTSPNGAEVSRITYPYISIPEYIEKYGVSRASVTYAITHNNIDYVICNGRKFLNVNDTKAFRKLNPDRFPKHKYKREGRLHRIYHAMRHRCYDPKHNSYRWYGAKGIKICDEWLEDFDNFANWALNHGYRDDLQIDRIDRNGNYCPANCRWVTREQNNDNRVFGVREGKRPWYYTVEWLLETLENGKSIYTGKEYENYKAHVMNVFDANNDHIYAKDYIDSVSYTHLQPTRP